MAECHNIYINLNLELYNALEKFRLSQKFIPSRKQIIEMAIDEYLKIHAGLPYIITKIK